MPESGLYDSTGAFRTSLSGAGVGSANTSPTTAGSYQQANNFATSQPLPSIPADATKATVKVGAQPVRWRSDGVAPTAAIGMPAAVGDTLYFYGAEIAAVWFIQTAATAILDVYYSK